MDEEQKDVTTEVSVEQTPTSESSTEGDTSSTQGEVAEESPSQEDKTGSDADAGSTEDGTQRKPTGAEKRIRGLANENKSLKAKLAEYTGQLQGEPVGGYPNMKTNPETGYLDVTPGDIRAMARIEIEMEKNINRINVESSEAIQTYPELNPEHDNFDPELSEVVTDAVQTALEKNPTQSVKGLVERFMKPYKRGIDRTVAGQTQEMAKQASGGALRPTTTAAAPKKKSVSEMTVEEMEKEFGVVY